MVQHYILVNVQHNKLELVHTRNAAGLTWLLYTKNSRPRLRRCTSSKATDGTSSARTNFRASIASACWTQGFLREVIKGWLISTSPGAAPGDTTPWFASFWEFCARYCEFRFGTDWHLSPEQSLLLHAEDTVIPTQVIVYSPKGTNNTISLLFGTSLYDLKSKMPNAADLMVKNGLRLFKPATALVRISEDFMRRHPPRFMSCSRASGIRPKSSAPCLRAAIRSSRGASPEPLPASAAKTSPTKSSRR